MHISRRGLAATGLTGAALALAACGGHRRATPAARLTTPNPPKVAVPRLTGARIATAERRLRDAGLVERPMYSGSVGSPQITTRCYVVLSQGPAPGTRLATGSAVGIAVGVCPAAMAKHYKDHRQ